MKTLPTIAALLAAFALGVAALPVGEILTRVDPATRLGCSTDSECEGVPRRVVVGVGCEGPSRIAVALEEDMLPRCAVVEGHWVEDTYR